MKLLIEKLKEILTGGKYRVKDIFIETGEGNTFLVKGVRYSSSDNAVFLQIDKNSMKWAEINGKHPVKLTTDKPYHESL